MKMRPDKPSIQNSPQVWRVQIRHSVVAQGAVPLHRALALILEERDNGVSEILRELLVEMSERQRLLEDRLKRYDQRITEFARADERAGRLMAVEGVGPLTATALIAAVGNARQFRSGRELSTWLGLVPRQHSSGGRSVLLGITSAAIVICEHC